MESFNIIDSLAETNQLYEMIGALISADQIETIESCKTSNRILNEMKMSLNDSNLNDDEKNNLSKHIDEALCLIKSECLKFTNNTTR